jgi:hypothetical protein
MSSHLISKKLKAKITAVLPVVLYGCKTWFLTLREEHRLRVFEKRVWRRIFGPKREEDGSWRGCTGEERSVYRVLVGWLKGKRLLERPNHRWEDNGPYRDRDHWGEIDLAGSG